MSGRWWKGNECRGASILFHLFWLQTVGNSRLSKASHHLFLFLNMSVPQSVKLGNFLFGFQQRKDLIAAISPFLPSQMFHVWISIPFQLFIYLFYFYLQFPLHFSLPKTNTSVILTVMTPISQSQTFCFHGMSQVEWFPSSSDCVPFSTRVHLVPISAEQDVMQETGCQPPALWYQCMLRWRSTVEGPQSNSAETNWECTRKTRYKRDKQQSMNCYCTMEETTYWQKQRSRIE